MLFNHKGDISPTGLNILQKRYFKEGETTWKQVASRVVDWVCKDEAEDIKDVILEMIAERYFIPNSPCLVNSGKEGGGLSACFVVDFPDNIEGIYKTKYDFALIARKGGGCGTTLTKLRPEGSKVSGSTHGYAAGPVNFFNTICHDMEIIAQGGFRAMAMMGTMSVYHPDIIKFIEAKTTEGKMSTTNISVVVDNQFMENVVDDEYYSPYFNKIHYETYKARDIFNKIVDGAWKNGEPGLLFYDSVNDSPYRYAGQEILATNPCLHGDTLIQTVEGQIKIKDLVGKSIDVYCMSDDGTLEISNGFNIRKTKENSTLIRIQTTRGHLICTPDHIIFTRNRGYVEAQTLTRDDIIVGLNRKMKNNRYCSVGISGSLIYEPEHRFIMRHYEDISDKDVHHIDGDYVHNVKSNLQSLSHQYHSSITNLGHEDWNERDSMGRYLPKDSHKKKSTAYLKNGNTRGVDLRIIGLEILDETSDVYDMEVETFHNFIANGVVVHNCGEQPLPPNGVCNLGSLDISKFLDEDNTIDMWLLETATRLSIKFLDDVVSRSTYPTKDITEWAENNRPVGLGIMGLADYYIKRGIAYGSDKALEELEFILSFMKNIAEDESITLGEERGIPFECAKLPIPRRNITLLSIAPTGTISLIADCNSGIEPFFSEITIRTDKTGTYELGSLDDIPEHFRCAVSANGATEVTWEEHVRTQASAQKFVDSGVSKTINFPHNTHRDTIAKAFILAWQLGCKGITVYRNGSRDVEVLSPKNLKKDLCPVCESPVIKESGCTKCSSCDWSICEVS